MTIRHAIWKVGIKPEPLSHSALPSEAQLEDMIVAAPSIISDQWMLIGRQVDTGFGGRLDLLAIAPDGGLVLIELKRDKTPRDVVAQAIDYATFIDGMQAEEIAAIFAKFSGGKDLGSVFRERFGQILDDDMLNSSHQMVVVAPNIDDSTSRIVKYLSERDIAINVLCFQVFASGSETFISRAWLLDPVQVQANTSTAVDGPKQPWNGETYASFGHGESRSWAEAQKYGFMSAGGGTWYTNGLNLLNLDERIWVKAPGYGFVGVGRVKGKPVRAADFTIPTPEGPKPALEVLKVGSYHREQADDPEKSEYFVPVEWIQTVPIEQAVQKTGMFGNQNTICRPTTPKWQSTVERLKLHFPNFDCK
jgi:hypothetical protein